MAEILPGEATRRGISRIKFRATAAPAGGFTAMDLSAGTLVDPNGLLDAPNSTLGAVSTIALNNIHGLWDAGLDGLGFFFSLGALPALIVENSGVVLRVKITGAPPSPWRLSMGFDANAGAPAWTAGGFMGGMLKGNCFARNDSIGGGGGSGSNLGAGNLGRYVDTYVQFNPLSTGNVGPAVRGLLCTISDATKANCASVGAQVTPAATLAGTGYAILGIGNTSGANAADYTGVEASYQLIPRQP